MLPIQREITQIKHAVCYLIAELFLNNLFWRQHCQSSFAMTISMLVSEINTRSYCIVSLAMRCSLLYCLSTFLSFYMHKFPKAGNLNE